MRKNILNSEYDFVFGIGEACATSSMLRLTELQIKSYPLDWLYGGDFEGRVDLLLNHFDRFINKNDLKKAGKRTNPEPCDIYANTHNQIVFNHDFPINGSLDTDYEAVAEKYKRRVDRLYRNIQKANNILVVYIEAPSRRKRDSVSSEQLLFNYQKIKEKYPYKVIDLLCIVTRKYWFRYPIKKNLSENIMMIKCNYRCRDKNTEPHVVDNVILQNILKDIKLSDFSKSFG